MAPEFLEGNEVQKGFLTGKCGLNKRCRPTLWPPHIHKPVFTEPERPWHAAAPVHRISFFYFCGEAGRARTLFPKTTYGIGKVMTRGKINEQHSCQMKTPLHSFTTQKAVFIHLMKEDMQLPPLISILNDLWFRPYYHFLWIMTFYNSLTKWSYKQLRKSKKAHYGEPPTKDYEKLGHYNRER